MNSLLFSITNVQEYFEPVNGWLYSPFLQTTGWCLLHSLWIIAALAVLLRITRCFRLSPRSNYRLALGTLILCAMLPLAAIPFAPDSLPVPAVSRAWEPTDPASSIENQHERPEQDWTERERPEQERPEQEQPVLPAATFDEGIESGDFAPEFMPKSKANPEGKRESQSASNKDPERSSSPSMLLLLQPWLPLLTLVWVAGLLPASVRPLLGLYTFRRLKTRGCSAVPGETARAFGRLMERLSVRRPVQLVTSTLATVPTAVGFLRPMVLLPVSTLTNLSAGELDSILAHELAHLKRFDDVVNLVQTGLETILFYHPCAWWISHVIRHEREYCCDDLALSVCDRPAVLASALLQIEQRRQVQPLLAASGGQLLKRIRRLENRNDPTTQTQNYRSSGMYQNYRTASLVAILSIALVTSGSVFFATAQSPGEPDRSVENVDSISRTNSGENHDAPVRGETYDDQVRQDPQFSVADPDDPGRDIFLELEELRQQNVILLEKLQLQEELLRQFRAIAGERIADPEDLDPFAETNNVPIPRMQEELLRQVLASAGVRIADPEDLDPFAETDNVPIPETSPIPRTSPRQGVETLEEVDPFASESIGERSQRNRTTSTREQFIPQDLHERESVDGPPHTNLILSLQRDSHSNQFKLTPQPNQLPPQPNQLPPRTQFEQQPNQLQGQLNQPQPNQLQDQVRDNRYFRAVAVDSPMQSSSEMKDLELELIDAKIKQITETDKVKEADRLVGEGDWSQSQLEIAKLNLRKATIEVEYLENRYRYAQSTQPNFRRLSSELRRPDRE